MNRSGLAAERTALAWRRTAVGAMVVGALFLNHAARSGWRLTAIVPIGAAFVMAVLAGACYLRNRSLHEGRYGHGGRMVAAATAAVVTIAIVAAVIGFTNPLL